VICCINNGIYYINIRHLHLHVCTIAKRVTVLMHIFKEVSGPCVFAAVCLRFTIALELQTFLVLDMWEKEVVTVL
jgi:hypothetical protein